jgi:hypothetical protein
MSKKLLNKIESFLKKKVKIDDRSDSGMTNFNLAIEELRSIFNDLANEKIVRDCDNWRGMDFVVVNKRTMEPFHFEPISKESTIERQLQLAVINAKIANDEIERLSRKLIEIQEFKNLKPEVIKVSAQDFNQIVKAINKPAKPNKKLKEAMRKHRDKFSK